MISGSGVCSARPAPPAHGKAGDSCLDTCYPDTCTGGDPAGPGALACFVSDGLACHAPDLTCQPLPKIGESCVTGGCVTGAFCDSGTCAAQRDAGPCQAGDQTCAPTSFCNDTGQCQLKLPDGSPCSADDWCQIKQCVYPESGSHGVCTANSLANDKACSGGLG